MNRGIKGTRKKLDVHECEWTIELIDYHFDSADKGGRLLLGMVKRKATERKEKKKEKKERKKEMRLIDGREEFRKVQGKGEGEEVETKWIKIKQKITRILKKGCKSRSGKRRNEDRWFDEEG